MKFKIGQVLLFGVLGGFLLAIAFVNPFGGDIFLSELILQLSGSRGEFVLDLNIVELVSFITRMLPTFIFEIYFGTLLYQHFCTASIYVFSRYTKRIRWYFSEVFIVGAYSCLFQIVAITTIIITTIMRYNVQFDKGGIGLLVCHLILQTAWIYSMTLLINVVAILIGSSSSFMVVMGGQIICVTLLGCIGTLQRYLDTFHPEILIALNPLSRLVMGWQSSNIKVIQQKLNSPYVMLKLEYSILIVISISALITGIGALIVKRHDLIIADSEIGGI